MAIQIQLRRDTSANWTSTNPILAQGEMGYETNTRKFKVGNGTTAWNSLPYDLAADISGSKFILQTANALLPNAQALGALSTGILKNTTTTGVLSIAVANTDYLTPTGNGSGLTGLTKSQVGLGNVDNTSDLNKPVSTATQTALNLKANISGQVFTGAISATNLSGSNTGDETTATIKTKLGAASSSTDGYLTSADWNTFNNKQNTLTFGNLTQSSTPAITIVGGTGAVIGSGASISIANATTSQSGLMSSTDKTKLDGMVGVLQHKSGIISGSSFTGNPKKYTVTFTTAYSSANYSISICSTNARNFTYESKTASGFTINANANTTLTGEVSWSTSIVGE